MKVKKRWIATFLTPAVLLYIFVYALSLITLIATSFSDWRIGGEIDFIGISNYKNLFAQEAFHAAVMNTIKWILLQSTIHVLIGVIFALLISKRTRYTAFASTVFMIPNIISSAALGMMYLCILNSKFGLVNSVVRMFGNESFSQNWFMDPNTAFFSVTMTWLPFAATVAMLVKSEMTTVSSSIYEAADIDGASGFQKSWYVTLPLMKHAIGTGVIISATSMLQKLDLILMTTNGGPGTKTLNLPLYIYETSMRDNQFGLASAQGVILILIGLFSILIINRIYGMNKEI